MKEQPPAPRRVRQTQDERRAQTYRQFLEAARILFARQGFEGTSLDQIAELAGYSRGAFHYAFASKQDLLLALMRACFQDDIRALEGLHPADAASQADEFRARGNATPLNRETHLLKLEFWICALRFPQFGEAYAQEFAAYRSALARLVGQVTASGGLTGEQAAAVLVALSNGLDTQRLIDPQAIPADLYDQVLRHFVSPPPLT